ncbi:uncharacterized protein LOC143034946 [Oratosquilla oratoria]|uniref:uncharacterized protein LOC143034946 n=1 Tax=Oratosquilla oratoria TaxID=337810 RepID=UPI003F768234
MAEAVLANQESGPSSGTTAEEESSGKRVCMDDLGQEKTPEGGPKAYQTEKCINISTPKSRKRKAGEPLEEETSSRLSRRTITLNSPSQTAQEIEEIKSRIASKEEKLRKLKLARTYRAKWEMQDLRSITDVWLNGCRSALLDLRSKLQEKGAMQDGSEHLTLDTLLQHLGIDQDLVGLDAAEDCFV